MIYRKIENFLYNHGEDDDAFPFFLVLTFLFWAPAWVISRFFGYIVEFIDTNSQ
jgi:hypothetical protein